MQELLQTTFFWRQIWRVAERESGSPELLEGPVPGSFLATSPEVLSLWNLTAIQRFTASFPIFPGSSPDFSGSSPDFPGGQPLSLGSLTPSPDSQKLSLIFYSEHDLWEGRPKRPATGWRLLALDCLAGPCSFFIALPQTRNVSRRTLCFWLCVCCFFGGWGVRCTIQTGINTSQIPADFLMYLFSY